MQTNESQQKTAAAPATAAVPTGPDPDVAKIMGEFKPFLSVPLEITIELGRANISIGDLLDMGYHSVFELNKSAGNNLDVYVNDVLLGRGEVLVIEDRVGIKLNEFADKHD